MIPQTYFCFSRNEKKTFKETTKYLTEKGFALSQKYPSGVLMTSSEDFHPLSSISHRNSSIVKILVKPDVLQEIPVDIGTGRQSTLIAYPIHHRLGVYLNKSKTDKGYPQLGYNTYF